MPSKIRQIQIRLPWLRKQKGGQADAIVKAVMEHPSIKAQIEIGCCPICGKPFDECEYFQSLED